MITQPQPGEYASFYEGYINKAAQAGNVLQTLVQLKDSTFGFFTSLPPEKTDYAYAEGKWTIKQLLSHMIDAERVFAFRLLCFLRRDATPLPGFDENAYVEQTDLSNFTLQNLAAEFKALREANLFLYNSVTDEQSLYQGTANGRPVSVRALLYITAGHELHHISIIKERYL
ncbi:DinB family protein [Mucilaginibacter terrae]|uniref:Damage-inducible protein DinB n=1 Tax=Mucilaginibacter terrae TaxID=1955052 RepID=A0ABU3GVX5_9SPHI|nr:DinB family protein [Mucilaginibacter terrae]MDT3403919.1 putative damage-inducible protein DinB [Mucilaginibacter terrae]